MTSGVQRGSEYDARWEAMAARGESVHGEADFVQRLHPRSVLDAGCGTGRVAIELARRGIEAVGVDLDDAMLNVARSKAPDLVWVTADLVDVRLHRTFDVVVMPGNVMVFVDPGTERAVVANMADHVAPEGHLVAGFQLDRGYPLARYDDDCTAAGLVLESRFSTWDGDPWVPAGKYAVSVHHRPRANPPVE